MLRIYTHNIGSEGLSNLRTALNPFITKLHEALRRHYPEIACNSVRPILASDRPEAPAFRGSKRIILGWGNSTPLAQDLGASSMMINKPESIGRATNKKKFFEVITAHNETCQSSESVSIPEWTTERHVARDWLAERDNVVYARTVLSGHSGDGIVVARDTGSVPSAQLYTKGITGSRREYRVHIYKGKVIHVQTKRRRSGTVTGEDVRNLDNGWVFGVSNVNLSESVRLNAKNAIAALGLDFGAVDIIAKGRAGAETESWVLEVNTAPGQRGETTINRYARAICEDIVNFYYHHILQLTGARVVNTRLTQMFSSSMTPAEFTQLLTLLPVVAREEDEQGGSDGGEEEVQTSARQQDSSTSIFEAAFASVSTPRVHASVGRGSPTLASRYSAASDVVEAPIPTTRHTRPTSQIRASRMSGEIRSDNYYAVCSYVPRPGVAAVTSICEVDIRRNVAWVIGVDAPLPIAAVTLVSEVVIS